MARQITVNLDWSSTLEAQSREYVFTDIHQDCFGSQLRSKSHMGIFLLGLA